MSEEGKKAIEYLKSMKKEIDFNKQGFVYGKETIDTIINLTEKQAKEIEEIIDALDSITWYNGLAEMLIKVKEKIKTNDDSNYLMDKLINDEQFEVIWMILVILFGDYGTSPRSGWLKMENKEQIINFIDKITYTYRNYNEM